MTGQIRVTVQEADRLHAITQLAEAMVHLARALNVAPQVMVTRCHFEGSEVGLNIDTSPDIMETMIKDLDDD